MWQPIVQWLKNYQIIAISFYRNIMVENIVCDVGFKKTLKKDNMDIELKIPSSRMSWSRRLELIRAAGTRRGLAQCSRDGRRVWS
jgi:hypothetical protein